jgi:two-component system, OmpR family, phosphate regulon response regulator PhoB
MTDTQIRTALIVEDQEEVADVIQATLESVGIQVQHAPNGNKAVALLNQQHPDLIILDIRLPGGMSGWDVLEVIQEWRKDEKTRVVVVSAFIDPANRLIGKLQHVDHYLFKPFEVTDLRNIVVDLLGLNVA